MTLFNKNRIIMLSILQIMLYNDESVKSKIKITQ